MSHKPERAKTDRLRRATETASMRCPDAQHLHDLLTAVVNDSGAHIGVLYLLDEDQQVLVMDAGLGFPASIAKAWSRVRTTTQMPVALALRERRLVWLADQEDMAHSFPGTALALPYHFSVAAVPICVDDSACGVLLLAWPEGQEKLTAVQRRVIQQTCRRMGRTLYEAARSGEPLRPRAQPLMLSPSRGRQPDRDAGMAALDCLNGLPEGYLGLDLDGRITFLTAPAAELIGDSPSRLIGERPWEALPWLHVAEYEDCYLTAVISRKPTSFTAQRPGGQVLAVQLYPAPQGVSVRVTPDPMARGPEFLTPAPPQAGGRMADAPTLYTMLHLSALLSQAVTVQDIVDLVADHLLPILDAQFLGILSAESDRTVLLAGHGAGKERIQTFNEWSTTTSGTAGAPADATEPVFFSSRRDLRKVYPPAAHDPVSACAVLPLSTPKRILGTLVIGYDRPHEFTADERTALTSLTGLVAQALDRAKLYEVKHHLAQSLQASLLPRRLPHITGLEVTVRYLPATEGMEIGGDFYDLIQLGEECVAAVIGDVQGHDPTAAALMGEVRTAIRAHAAADADPGEVLKRTNRLLLDLTPDRFTSCLYVIIDMGRQLLEVASAGHPPALLHHWERATQLIEPAPGLLLGIDPHAAYQTTQVPLPAEGTLALYTDGLIEAPGVLLDDAIADLCLHLDRHARRPLQELAEALIEPIANKEPRIDDTALLLLRPSD